MKPSVLLGSFGIAVLDTGWTTKNIGKYELSAYCAVLGKEFPFAGKLNSQARQASAERARSAISRFYDNCKKKKPGNIGFPRFKKHQTHGCVEYKTTGWKLSEDRRTITFSDGFEAGSFKLWGTRDLHFYQLKQIKRVRVVPGDIDLCLGEETPPGKSSRGKRKPKQ